MNTRFKRLHSIVLTAALSTLTGHSMAQPAPNPGSAMATNQGHPMGHGDPAKMQAHRAKQLAAFKGKLQITAAQEADWTSFVESRKPPVHAPMATAPTDQSQLPTPERLDRMRALHTEHMAMMTARMDQRMQATRTFYAVLSPDQKKVFDAQFNDAWRAREGHHRAPMNGPHGHHPG